MATRTSAAPGSGAVYIEAGSQADTADIIAAQDLVRAQARDAAMKKWAPWVIGLLVVGGGAYFYLRD